MLIRQALTRSVSKMQNAPDDRLFPGTPCFQTRFPSGGARSDRDFGQENSM